MNPIDPKKRIVREHLRVVNGHVEVILRQSKEIGQTGWTLEKSGIRSRSGSGRRTPEQIARLSDNDYVELILDSERGWGSMEVSESAFRKAQLVLWGEVSTKGRQFSVSVWEKVYPDMSSATRKIALSVLKDWVEDL